MIACDVSPVAMFFFLHQDFPNADLGIGNGLRMRTLALVAVGRSWRGETGLAAGVEPEWLDWRGTPEKVIACTAQSA